MSVQDSIARMQKSMELDRRLIGTMMSVSSGRPDPQSIASLEQITDEYESLLTSTPPDEQLVTAAMLREKLADVADWQGRALENAGRAAEALDAFLRAASMFEAAGKQAQAGQARNKAAELRMEIEGDYDEEIQRLRAALDNAPPESIDRAEILIKLGELHSKANDDVEALTFLHEAEKLGERWDADGSRDTIMRSLPTTFEAIENGQLVAGNSELEVAVRKRALLQRLWFALSNAYRTTNPKRADEYEKRLQAMDDGRVGDMHELAKAFTEGRLIEFVSRHTK